jgi:hypothetical protein
MRPLVILLAITALGPTLPASAAPPGCFGSDVVQPDFAAAHFTNPTHVDNPYFPLNPGRTFVYDGTDKHLVVHDEEAVTTDVKMILGVTCVVVRDTGWINGVLEEDTLDWYAQDDDGNVWYMGELASQYDSSGALLGHEGSWEGGVDGSKPGHIMEAHPHVGDTYQQEYLPGIAEDIARVGSVTGSASVPYGTWIGNVLVTPECSPLEPKVREQKYFAPGVGEVMSETLKGGKEHLALVAIR